jgi:plasmid stabilization system protein ParE
MIKREIIFSKVAKDKLESTLQFLETEWSVSTKRKFVKKLDGCFKQIDTFPNSFMYSATLKLNKCKVTKHTAFYYRCTENEISVYYFIDNRMNNIIDL